DWSSDVCSSDLLNTIALAEELGNRPHSDTLSLENLAQVDADWLLLASLTADGEQALVEAQKQPVFKRLHAVQNDRVKVVDGQVWSSGYGPKLIGSCPKKTL